VAAAGRIAVAYRRPDGDSVGSVQDHPAAAAVDLLVVLTATEVIRAIRQAAVPRHLALELRDIFE